MAGNKDFPPCRDFGAFLSRSKLAPNPGGDIAGNTRAVGYLGHVLSRAPNRNGLAMTLRESRYRTFPFSWAFCPGIVEADGAGDHPPASGINDPR